MLLVQTKRCFAIWMCRCRYWFYMVGLTTHNLWAWPGGNAFCGDLVCCDRAQGCPTRAQCSVTNVTSCVAVRLRQASASCWGVLWLLETAYFCIHICICYVFVSSMKLFLLLVDVLFWRLRAEGWCGQMWATLLCRMFISTFQMLWLNLFEIDEQGAQQRHAPSHLPVGCGPSSCGIEHSMFAGRHWRAGPEAAGKFGGGRVLLYRTLAQWRLSRGPPRRQSGADHHTGDILLYIYIYIYIYI